MKFFKNKIKFENDFLTIRALKNLTYLHFNLEDGRKIRAELTKNNTTPKQAEKLAPLLESLIKRVYFIAHLDGFIEGKKAGKTETQNEIKKILNI